MMGRFEDDDDDEEDDEDEPPTYEIDIRSVRIGSMRTQPDGPLLINLQGVCFKVRCKYFSALLNYGCKRQKNSSKLHHYQIGQSVGWFLSFLVLRHINGRSGLEKF